METKHSHEEKEHKKEEVHMVNHRTKENNVNELFLKRWSPRALSGEHISKKELMMLLEAARWAPSAFNGQPWRFVYALKGTDSWNPIFETLADFNKAWVVNAGAVILVISKTKSDYDGSDFITHSFDTGAAWENIALQATELGLVAHGMTGFDFAKAKAAADIPDGYAIQAMIAIGKPGKKEDLPEMLRDKEVQSDRKPLSELAFDGKFVVTN